jgi:hypothetical protein
MDRPSSMSDPETSHPTSRSSVSDAAQPPDFQDSRLAAIRSLGPFGDRLEALAPYGMAAHPTLDVLDIVRLTSDWKQHNPASIV